MKLELFNIIRGKIFHWFTLSFGEWFYMGFTTAIWFEDCLIYLYIIFGEKEFKKIWKLKNKKKKVGKEEK